MKELKRAPFWQRYQEKDEWSDYAEAREEVCDIYGVDSNTAHVHHIVSRRDVLDNPEFEGMDLNEPSNLYPFRDTQEAVETHSTKQDHVDLHNRVGKRAYLRRQWKEREEKAKRKNRW